MPLSSPAPSLLLLLLPRDRMVALLLRLCAATRLKMSNCGRRYDGVVAIAQPGGGCRSSSLLLNRILLLLLPIDMGAVAAAAAAAASATVAVAVTAAVVAANTVADVDATADDDASVAVAVGAVAGVEAAAGRGWLGGTPSLTALTLDARLPPTDVASVSLPVM